METSDDWSFWHQSDLFSHGLMLQLQMLPPHIPVQDAELIWAQLVPMKDAATADSIILSQPNLNHISIDDEARETNAILNQGKQWVLAPQGVRSRGTKVRPVLIPHNI